MKTFIVEEVFLLCVSFAFFFFFFLSVFEHFNISGQKKKKNPEWHIINHLRHFMIQAQMEDRGVLSPESLVEHSSLEDHVSFGPHEALSLAAPTEQHGSVGRNTYSD